MDYAKLANSESLQKTTGALKKHGYDVLTVKTGTEALTQIKNLIPAGKSIMNGASVTLEQIGFVELLKSGNHEWNNLHAAIAAEKDPVKQQVHRNQAQFSDYYLGSVHALAETGDFIIASNTASQLPHVVYTSKNLIFVVSTKKIVPNLDEAMKRLNDYVVPLENKHMMEKYGSGTHVNKIVIFKGESPYGGRKITFILIEEDLGF